MAIKYETARSLKFNIWFFIATALVVTTLSIFATYNHLTGEMSPFAHATFNEWLGANAQEILRPGGKIFGFPGREILAQVASLPSIHSEFVSSAKLIFVWAPVGTLISMFALWILGHALSGWHAQTKGKK